LLNTDINVEYNCKHDSLKLAFWPLMLLVVRDAGISLLVAVLLRFETGRFQRPP
jgi:hypothetical protein